MLPGVEPESVLDLITARRESGRGDGDGRKLGLVIEGGGMRGVYSAGCLIALDCLGLRNVFDEVYATSAGSINAAYFLSGQGKMGITIYFEDINNRKFINPLRFYKIADIDYCFDHVVSRVKPLDTKAIVNGGPRLFISFIDRNSAEGFSLAADSLTTPLVTAFKASSALPLIYNRSVEVEGRLCLDGGLISAIPIYEAIEGGCTDVLVLLTRPRDYYDSPLGWMELFFFDLLCARGNMKLKRVYRDMPKRYNERRRFAFGEERFQQPVRIATICPDDGDLSVDRTTTETCRLIDASVRLGCKTYEAFEQDPRDFVDEFRGVTSADCPSLE